MVLARQPFPWARCPQRAGFIPIFGPDRGAGRTPKSEGSIKQTLNTESQLKLPIEVALFRIHRGNTTSWSLAYLMLVQLSVCFQKQEPLPSTSLPPGVKHLPVTGHLIQVKGNETCCHRKEEICPSFVLMASSLRSHLQEQGRKFPLMLDDGEHTFFSEKTSHLPISNGYMPIIQSRKIVIVWYISFYVTLKAGIDPRGA